MERSKRQSTIITTTSTGITQTQHPGAITPQTSTWRYTLYIRDGSIGSRRGTYLLTSPKRKRVDTTSPTFPIVVWRIEIQDTSSNPYHLTRSLPFFTIIPA
jgi:hypothetical protein